MLPRLSNSLDFRSLTLAAGLMMVLPGLAGAADQPAARPANGQPAAERVNRPVAPLFLKEEWTRHAVDNGESPVVDNDVSTPELEVKVYGTDTKNLLLSGKADNPAGPVNLWNGTTTAPVSATVRNKNNYVDLTGLAKIKWVIRTSGFHAVRPVVKLADGTVLVGDATSTSTAAAFVENEIAIAGVRWIKLDPDRVVTKGNWVENPDLSKVDEVGYADLMPGSGHGPGGWVNVSRFEVYGAPVKR